MPKLFRILAFFLLTFTYFASGLAVKEINADSTGFLTLINQYRASNSLGTLVEDQKLTDSSCWFSSDMGVKNYFPSDHVDSLGRTMAQRLSAFGVSGIEAENIFYTTVGSSANYAFDGWKNSLGHNANMLGTSYTRIGIGRSYYSNRWYWTTDFANGTATTLTSQCGQVTIQPPPPPPTAKVVPPPIKTVNPPALVTVTPPTVAVNPASLPMATQSAPKVVLSSSQTAKPKVATSSKIVANKNNNQKQKNLVLGIFVFTSGPLLSLTSLWVIKPTILEGLFKKLILR